MAVTPRVVGIIYMCKNLKPGIAFFVIFLGILSLSLVNPVVAKAGCGGKCEC